MGRESSHGIKELLNLPPLVLKARHPGGSASCLGLGLPEQAMGWLPLSFGIGSRRTPLIRTFLAHPRVPGIEGIHCK